jgi:hypothetical protein
MMQLTKKGWSLVTYAYPTPTWPSKQKNDAKLNKVEGRVKHYQYSAGTCQGHADIQDDSDYQGETCHSPCQFHYDTAH